ncbi:MAG: Acetoin:2,6-dichlorophenolindophenol oxidoreductase subunit alpha [Proteobacteria bacterium]|nr:MAG: Acetoin:2,6-dichlorophenolindophenol oxidoreductase subunit alpha [Pseudomonadota bacterium]|tara:strand:- start:122 stop:1114 length:993 start_codon:yes stop_codon:yes gene_type:complete
MNAQNIEQFKSEYSTEQLIEVYRQMLRFRRMSEKTAQMYQQGLIGGFCHLYTGQEAVLAGTFAECEKGDDHITSYRCHAHALACGVDEKEVLAELTGRATGISKGKGGSMHMFAPDKGYWGGHGIVGAQVPLGTGMAFYHKYMGNQNICVTSYGDGAANQGQIFEAMNMASLWGLPVLYVVENNVYGMGTAAKRVCAGELHQRGAAFGIEGEKVDGQDFFTVAEAVKRARKYILENKRPYIIEMDTYRYRGHSMSDPAKYRSKEEVQAVKENRDPLIRIYDCLVDERGVKESELKEIDNIVKANLKESVDFAVNSPLPDAAELMTDIMPK